MVSRLPLQGAAEDERAKVASGIAEMVGAEEFGGGILGAQSIYSGASQLADQGEPDAQAPSSTNGAGIGACSPNNPTGETTRVGRWMGQGEFDKIQSSVRVVWVGPGMGRMGGGQAAGLGGVQQGHERSLMPMVLRVPSAGLYA